MKILVDENIPLMTVRMLRELGHDVKDIRGTSLQGIDDEKIWQIATREERLLITTDKGFTLHRHESHSGVVIIRLRKPNRLRIHQRVIQAITSTKKDEWTDTMVVMRDVVQSVWRTQE